MSFKRKVTTLKKDYFDYFSVNFLAENLPYNYKATIVQPLRAKQYGKTFKFRLHKIVMIPVTKKHLLFKLICPYAYFHKKNWYFLKISNNKRFKKILFWDLERLCNV